MQILITGGALGLLSVFAGIIATLYAYIQFEFPPEFTGLLISALGALSTLFLVVVTFATFAENQLLKVKERQRPLVREELTEVGLRVTEILEQNRSNVVGQNPSSTPESCIRWDKIVINADEEFNPASGLGLQPLYPRSDIDTVVFDRYMERNPEVSDLIKEHDRRLQNLTDAARELVEKFQTPIAQYTDDNGVNSKTGNVHEPLLASLILNEHGDLQNNTHEDLWNQHREGLRTAVKEEYEQAFRGFCLSKRDYVEFVCQLENEIKKARERTQEEYNVSVHD